MPGAFIVEQVRAVVDDIGVDAVKIGMLGTAETVRAVAEALELLDPRTPVVLDPVMVVGVTARCCSTRRPAPRWCELLLPRRDRDHPERPGGRGSPRPQGRR